MPTDLRLAEAGVPEAVVEKLEEAAINSVRQLYDRLRGDGGGALRRYLGLGEADFDQLYRRVEQLVGDEYPEDMLDRIHPKVNKRGVAVHRLNDPARPRFGNRREE